MRGGMKVYAGGPAAARHYIGADRGRADDYYLAKGAGIARRYAAGAGRVRELAPLSGEDYEGWVAGLDPATGEPRGRLRTDDRAVRFVEVVVNGPKSWSLAAALHPDIAAAYDAAQDCAVEQILAWLSEHATTRVGSRGVQVQVPVEVLEAASVQHYTSRAGDPHRHLHLQLLARVFAAEKWRGLHTVAIRDFLAAINGIGHAAMATDPQLRAAWAAHGYTPDATGELLQLAPFVGPMSARAAQIATNIARYEREWTQTHPGEHAGPALRRAWEARAWADGRPDKVHPRPGEVLEDRWREELTVLGYRDPAHPVAFTPTPVGALDRNAAADRVLTRLAAARSAWNAADIRGEVEQMLAADGIVAEAAVRLELAEDLTARALSRCVPLLEREGVPEHIRAWTSRPVLDVEADLAARFAARAGQPALPEPRQERLPAWAVAGLDDGQAAAIELLAGGRQLVVMEGAAGAGKTTTLAATRYLLECEGRGLAVVTPTMKAAKVARTETGAPTGSAAWLAYQYGWRWTESGDWTRLTDGQLDPRTGHDYTGPGVTWLRPGDLLVIDEAGMLNQDTARALLHIADECQARVALLGDRHQLAAVGRGGVLDLAAAATDRVDPGASLNLESVHRFTRTDAAGATVPDDEYAQLTLAMRRGHDSGAVFDALLARNQIRLHLDFKALCGALAEVAADGPTAEVALVADTLEQVDALSATVQARLVTAGRVDDADVVTTRSGQRIGAGDRIATRRNDRGLDVANRDTWTVTAVDECGGLLVTPCTRGGDGPGGEVTSTGPDVRVLPADYVTDYVELAYASTVHGVQGDTVTAAHLVLGHHTGAAAAYVGMTRGRTANTAHLIAADPDEAREQWIAAFSRDRADLGSRHAAGLAAREADRYAPIRPLDQPPATRARPPAPAPGVRRPDTERRGPSMVPRVAALGIGR
ncbi:AAA domain-containing protein [Trujillonella endophytica]|uniref:AAA domain-containing protein n=1 Tax=Trujillonella endophytica TaxID=673521 RepID=A0A1H8SA77_9ACTN|nr:AAA domain-containing protein [Trujillella endophytica]